MKKYITLLICIIFVATSAYGAGKMENVSQEVNLDKAEITTKSATGGGSFRFGGVEAEGGANYGGTVNIAEIINDKGDMNEINQKVSAEGAIISTDGADINIARIKNK